MQNSSNAEGLANSKRTTWFPELAPIAEFVDDAVIDGEIILGNGSVESFNTCCAVSGYGNDSVQNGPFGV
jgi:hypothetical protein